MKTLNQLAKFINAQEGYPSDVCGYIEVNGWESKDENVLATDGKMNLIINDDGVAVLKPIKERKMAKMLTELRTGLGISQRRAAKTAGISYVTICKVENSQTDMTSTKLIDYLDALGYELKIVKKA